MDDLCQAAARAITHLPIRNLVTNSRGIRASTLAIPSKTRRVHPEEVTGFMRRNGMNVTCLYQRDIARCMVLQHRREERIGQQTDVMFSVVDKIQIPLNLESSLHWSLRTLE